MNMYICIYVYIYISFQLLEERNTTTSTHVIKIEEKTKHVHFEIIPTEIFCQILTFLGSTSQDLITLSQVNVHYNKIMNRIGQEMLKCAEKNFHFNVWSVASSDITSFVYLTRECRKVQRRISVLHEIYQKDFVKKFTVDEMDQILDFCLTNFDITCSRFQENTLLHLCGKISSKAYISSKQKTSTQDITNKKLQKKAATIMTYVARKICPILLDSANDRE